MEDESRIERNPAELPAIRQGIRAVQTNIKQTSFGNGEKNAPLQGIGGNGGKGQQKGWNFIVDEHLTYFLCRTAP